MQTPIRYDKIKYLAIDIDGVLTSGYIIIDSKGNEFKHICVRDLDAVSIGRKLGFDFVLVTGEDNELVDAIARRFGISQVLRGAKDKLAALMSSDVAVKLKKEEVCYIGDSNRDAPAIKWAGFGVAPADASKTALAAADYVTAAKGGEGVLAEVVELLESQRTEPKSETRGSDD
jgi:3-deoxy-D-manno-octulosonate 8-phosphate phosphatase (KDO 8-P phosphatase)